MDKEHYNSLIQLSQEIYNAASDKLTNYCAARYCGVDSNSMEAQLEDYLFVAQETCAYFLGNALSLLDPESQEAEIQTFVANLRRVIRHAEKKMGEDSLPN